MNVLVGGWDSTRGGELYWEDYLGAMARVPYAVHGYSSYMALSTFDRLYRPDMDHAAALEVLEAALKQACHTRRQGWTRGEWAGPHPPILQTERGVRAVMVRGS